MFRAAIARASNFTGPIAAATKMFGGPPVTGLGACVLVNSDGWVLTAKHNVDNYETQVQLAQSNKITAAKRESIENDRSLTKKQRHEELRKLPRLTAGDPIDVITLCCQQGSKIVERYLVPEIDLALCRLEPFDADGILSFPVFKDPAQQWQAGTSLCTLGYPMLFITQWDDTTDELKIHGQHYAVESMLTRVWTREKRPDSREYPFPLEQLETSRMALPGQSGGPIIDSEGTVWGIHLRTEFYPIPLGAYENTPAGKDLPRLFPAGLGAYATSVVGLLQEADLKFARASY